MQINLKPWASPARAFRIKDKDQKLDQTTEDLEVAMALEREDQLTMEDDSDSDYSGVGVYDIIYTFLWGSDWGLAPGEKILERPLS